jgi:hypothetical protein
MAKLEDQITPAELLNIIRGGATKKEVCKQFRTSEQELAVMLLPLYRSRELTMEEFNDFFKGLALKPKEVAREGQPVPASPRPEDEPPSEILRSLSEKAQDKAREEKKKPVVVAVEEKPEPAPAQEAQLQAPPAPAADEAETDLEVEEILTEEETADDFVEEPDIEAEAVIEARRELEQPEAAEKPLPAAIPQPEAEAAPAKSREAAPPPATEPESMETRQALQIIIAKLSSIDEHLARIEKKLKNP